MLVLFNWFFHKLTCVQINSLVLTNLSRICLGEIPLDSRWEHMSSPILWHIFEFGEGSCELVARKRHWAASSETGLRVFIRSLDLRVTQLEKSAGSCWQQLSNLTFGSSFCWRWATLDVSLARANALFRPLATLLTFLRAKIDTRVRSFCSYVSELVACQSERIDLNVSI